MTARTTTTTLSARPPRWLGLAAGALICASGGCGEAPPEPFEVVEASIAELQTAMADGIVTSEQLVERYLARIDAYDEAGPALNAIIILNPDAVETARALDVERREVAPRGPLHGIPLLIKDNHDIAGLPTTNGSIAMAGLMPPDDAFPVRRLREAGAVLLGKTNLHEFARGITTISSIGGQTLNPYDPTRNPGGSSGGTGAAVAASFAAAGMGSDTCGSIRIPSAHNSLVGLRGTEGLSSRDGVVPLSHTQDIAGPLARSVADLVVLLDATVGTDPNDPVTLDADRRIPESYTSSLDPEALQGARLGVLTYLVRQDPEDEPAAELMDAAVADLERLGAEVVEAEIEGLAELLDTYVVLSHEFKFDLDAYLAATPGAPVSSLAQIIAEGLHLPDTAERLVNSNVVESLDTDEYREAIARRAVLSNAVIEVLDALEIDALIYPTMRQQAAPVGERQGGDNCRLSAQSGLPAITVPAGFTPDAMPIGLEMLGRPWAESRLIALAYAFEQGTGHRRPPASTPPLAARGPAGTNRP
ncbi:MAG TPA: amidase [Acidobacteria bacterium]|jgi:Asp-tRNA(Asn)/Glu-tRNA(Gln) amidotransferase A subunit family amidase|nr:amidase [Acidobacteriota bacterium]HAK56568.1 amidase [Acidobacteriota bacterium]